MYIQKMMKWKFISRMKIMLGLIQMDILTRKMGIGFFVKPDRSEYSQGFLMPSVGKARIGGLRNHDNAKLKGDMND